MLEEQMPLMPTFFYTSGQVQNGKAIVMRHIGMVMQEAFWLRVDRVESALEALNRNSSMRFEQVNGRNETEEKDV